MSVFFRDTAIFVILTVSEDLYVSGVDGGPKFRSVLILFRISNKTKFVLGITKVKASKLKQMRGIKFLPQNCWLENSETRS